MRRRLLAARAAADISLPSSPSPPSCPLTAPLAVPSPPPLAVQHIANMTLLGMNRPPQAHTLALLHKLRERIPALALRTTFISGFPGEGVGGGRAGRWVERVLHHLPARPQVWEGRLMRGQLA